MKTDDIIRLDPDTFVTSKQRGKYRPRLLAGDRYRRWLDGRPWFTLRDAEAMRRDPQVNFALRILRAALYQINCKITASNRQVARFVMTQFQKIWRTSLRQFLGFFEFGISCGELSFCLSKGRVVFDKFEPIHPADARPLEVKSGKHRGKWCGIRVRGSMAHDYSTGEYDILAPHAFWFAGEAEFGSYWSYPRMAGAYEPWLEKCGRHGAKQSRQLWFKKGAFSGGSIRYPIGKTSYDDGQGGQVTIDNQDLARQIAEDVMAGGVMSLPSTTDKNGNYVWVYEPPKAGNEVRNILDYPEQLDKEILIGFGIPPELVSAATVGSGYSGRAIPAQMFFSSLDEVVALLVKAIDEQIIRNLVRVNFGKQEYEIIPNSLAEKVGREPGSGVQGGDNRPPTRQQPAGNNGPVSLSITAKRRLIKRLKKLEKEVAKTANAKA